MMLLLTVHFAEHITRSLAYHRRQAREQSDRVRAMGDRLRRQEGAMMQQEKMAAMGQLAAGVAHEIANPLASMDSMLQLIQRKPDRMEPEAIRRLREQIGRIHGTVRQLTDFAHPSETRWETAEVSEVIDRALEILRFDRRIDAVYLDRNISAAAGQIRVQPHALEQVIINLVLNALDAVTDVAEPRLAIRALRREGECLIEIADNGHGIDPEDLPHLFEPFFTTKPVGKGTGLGLSISYSLIARQGGRIEVHSREGEGARFTVHLPAAQDSRN
jgi:C4-dicarboxylate-specific signal transduction histidine kinase